jgi:hypothetical protein
MAPSTVGTKPRRRENGPGSPGPLGVAGQQLVGAFRSDEIGGEAITDVVGALAAFPLLALWNGDVAMALSVRWKLHYCFTAIDGLLVVSIFLEHLEPAAHRGVEGLGVSVALPDVDRGEYVAVVIGNEVEANESGRGLQLREVLGACPLGGLFESLEVDGSAFGDRVHDVPLLHEPTGARDLVSVEHTGLVTASGPSVRGPLNAGRTLAADH